LFDTSQNAIPEIKKPAFINNKKFTFIVIDDDINLLNLTSGVLKQEKHKVLSFDRATKALEAVSNTNFDFIITDIQMPEMDGFTFIKKLRNYNFSTYKNQPIIALTGRTDLDLSVYTEAGFTTVIKKPYSPKVLLQTIQHILENKDIPTTEVNEAEPNSAQFYSLETLKEFLGNDDEALKDVIVSFVESTDENMVFLEKAISQQNIAEINTIAHRVAPMFRQIQANEIGNILKNLERKDLESEGLENIFENLKIKTKTLFTSLKQEIV
jgi:CheY-like chemotaxis protein